MKNHLKKIILTGIAGALLAPALVDASTVTLLTVGGNASIKLIQDRVPSILSGATLVPDIGGNSLIFGYTGTYGGNSVNWHFNLTGGAAAIGDIVNQNHVLAEDGNTYIPVSATSITAPETVGFDSSPSGLNLVQDVTLVAPLVYIENPNLAGIVTNLTQRQAYELEQAKATVPTSFFGGANSYPVYFVGRNSAAAVRQVIDANVYFGGTAYNYHTNGASLTPILWAGASSGSDVAANVKAITNSIGTVAVQDASTIPQLSYEGISFSVSNVISGSYPLWGYERYIYFPNGDPKAPSANQLALIQALETAVEDPTWQANSLKPFYNKFVSFAAVNASVNRDPTVDGSLILPGSLSLPIP
jgi:hypothetical protein